MVCVQPNAREHLSKPAYEHVLDGVAITVVHRLQVIDIAHSDERTCASFVKSSPVGQSSHFGDELGSCLCLLRHLRHKLPGQVVGSTLGRGRYFRHALDFAPSERNTLLTPGHVLK